MKRAAIIVSVLIAASSCRGGKAERPYTPQTGGRASNGAALMEVKEIGRAHV